MRWIYQSAAGVDVLAAGKTAKVMKMEKAYEEYFDGLAEGEEALSYAEFVEALS
ncbi:TPA: hypothetical protein IGN17_002477 [Escherichia coli]|nr:hypothetical protein [Escherichia coli]